MLHNYVHLLAPMLLGAQLILTLVLVKGDICPGQRGRVHKAMYFLVAGWALAAMNNVLMLLPFALLALFSIKTKTNKTREKGPLPLLYASNVIAAILWGFVLIKQDTLPAVFFSVVALPLAGAACAHLLLTQARTRLQAFHKILPIVGIISGMFMLLVVLWQASLVGEDALQGAITDILIIIASLVLGLVVWAWHLIRQITVAKVQLAFSTGLVVMSGMLQLQLL